MIQHISYFFSPTLALHLGQLCSTSWQSLEHNGYIAHRGNIHQKHRHAANTVYDPIS